MKVINYTPNTDTSNPSELYQLRYNGHIVAHNQNGEAIIDAKFYSRKNSTIVVYVTSKVGDIQSFGWGVGCGGNLANAAFNALKSTGYTFSTIWCSNIEDEVSHYYAIVYAMKAILDYHGISGDITMQ